MIKYAFIKVGIPTTHRSRFSFFNNVKFQVGRDILSFQDLENGILRGNRKAPFSLSHPFSKGDSRIELAMKTVDCRIHFALNCGAKSCPPVKDFTRQSIEQELRIVAQAFCEDDEQVRVDLNSETVYLSKLFSWYQEDFGKTKAELLKTIISFLRGQKRLDLKQLLYQRGDSVKINYNDYDWSTDASDYTTFSSAILRADVYRLARRRSSS